MQFSFALFLICSSLFAQNLSIGIKQGINNSGINFKYNYAGELSNPSFYGFGEIKNNFNPGLIIHYNLKNHFSLQTEFNFVNRGFEFHMNQLIYGDMDIYGDYRAHYLSVPFLACYELGRTFKVYGYSGLYLNFITSSKNKITIKSFPSGKLRIYDYSYNTQDEFNKSESGFVGGIGVKVPVYHQFKVFVDSRYEIGLTKAIKENIDYGNYHIVAAVKDSYNKAFSLNCGIVYTFANKND